MKRRRTHFSLAVFLVLIIPLTAVMIPGICKGKTRELSWGGVLWGTYKGLDPHTIYTSPAAEGTMPIFGSLIGKDVETGRYVPYQAESWTIAPDGLSTEFTIRKGIKFHNGEDLTAEDVKFSFERVMREDLKWGFGAEVRGHIDSVEMVDDYHVIIRLKKPYPGLLTRTAEYLSMVPKDYIEKVGDDGFAKNPVGAGPFKLVDFKEKQFINYEAVKNHYRVTPDYDKLHYVHVTESATMLAMLKTGELDLTDAIPGKLVPEVKKDPKLRIIWNKYSRSEALCFYDLINRDKPGFKSPFLDPRVRLAASLAINRKQICEHLLHGSATPFGGWLAPYHLGYEPKEAAPDPYDPARAKKLLAEAGYPNGFDTVLHTTDVVDWKMLSEAVAAQLSEVGIRAKLDVVELAMYLRNFIEGKYADLAYINGAYWSGRTPAGTALEAQTVGGGAPVGKTYPEIVEAIGKVMTAVGDEATADTARKANRVLRDKMVRTVLWANHTPIIVGPRVAYYENYPGFAYLHRLEYLKLKD